ITNYKRIVENENKLNSVIEEVESLNNKLKKVLNLVKELKENKRKLEEELKKFDIKELKEKEKVLNEDLLKKLNIIKEIELKLKELKYQIELKEKDKEFLIELNNKIEKNKKEIEELKKRIEKIEELIREIDNYKKNKELMFINNLSIIATEIIDFLTDGKFSKIKIKKNEKDKLEFSVVINGVEFNPFLLSGGEQTIFSLSLRLAMAEIFNLMNNNSFLILDEPTIHLDKEVIRRFILYLQQNKKFKQLIIISHEEEFESIADKLIKIEKGKDGFSKVEEII
ncbi:MAG: AAA family ATPase, partial [Nanoarchaeota archaeon]